jgi:hypothetical protein
MVLGGSALTAAVVASVVAIGATRAGDPGTTDLVAAVDAARTAPESTVPVVAADDSSTTTATTSTTVAPTTTTTRPRRVTAPTTVPAVTPTTVAPPTTAPTTTTTVPPFVYDIAVTPTSAPQSYPWPNGGPRLVWNVSGPSAAGVSVTGPNFFSDKFSGDMAVCPGIEFSVSCYNSPPGPRTYVLDVKNAAGQIIATRTAVLEITL